MEMVGEIDLDGEKAFDLKIQGGQKLAKGLLGYVRGERNLEKDLKEQETRGDEKKDDGCLGTFLENSQTSREEGQGLTRSTNSGNTKKKGESGFRAMRGMKKGEKGDGGKSANKGKSVLESQAALRELQENSLLSEYGERTGREQEEHEEAKDKDCGGEENGHTVLKVGEIILDFSTRQMEGLEGQGEESAEDGREDLKPHLKGSRSSREAGQDLRGCSSSNNKIMRRQGTREGDDRNFEEMERNEKGAGLPQLQDGNGNSRSDQEDLYENELLRLGGGMQRGYRSRLFLRSGMALSITQRGSGSCLAETTRGRSLELELCVREGEGDEENSSLDDAMISATSEVERALERGDDACEGRQIVGDLALMRGDLGQGTVATDKRIRVSGLALSSWTKDDSVRRASLRERGEPEVADERKAGSIRSGELAGNPVPSSVDGWLLSSSSIRWPAKGLSTPNGRGEEDGSTVGIRRITQDSLQSMKKVRGELSQLLSSSGMPSPGPSSPWQPVLVGRRGGRGELGRTEADGTLVGRNTSPDPPDVARMRIELGARKKAATRLRHEHECRRMQIEESQGRSLHMSLAVDMGNKTGMESIELAAALMMIRANRDTVARELIGLLQNVPVKLRVQASAALLLRSSATPRNDKGLVDEVVVERLCGFMAGQWAESRALDSRSCMVGDRDTGGRSDVMVWFEDSVNGDFQLNRSWRGGAPTLAQAREAMRGDTGVSGLRLSGRLAVNEAYSTLFQECEREMIRRLREMRLVQTYDDILNIGKEQMHGAVFFPSLEWQRNRTVVAPLCDRIGRKVRLPMQLVHSWGHLRSWCSILAHQWHSPMDLIAPSFPICGDLRRQMMQYDSYDHIWLLWISQQENSGVDVWRAYVMMRSPNMTSGKREHSLMLSHLLGLLDLVGDNQDWHYLWADLVGACDLLPAHRRLNQPPVPNWAELMKDETEARWPLVIRRLGDFDEYCLRVLAYSFPHKWLVIAWSYHQYRLHAPCTCSSVVGMCMVQGTTVTHTHE
jgi:hypothetical protein